MIRTVYLAPALVLLALVFIAPLVQSAALALGADYAGIWGDAGVRQSAVNSIAFAAVSVTLEMILGLLFALLLHQSFQLRGVVRAIALIPWALPTAVMAMAWRWIFMDTYGVASDMLVRIGLAERGDALLGQTGTAFAALVIADVWKTTPFVTIILLAGLQSIPKDLYEAMSIDGAGRVRQFFLVTLPLLRPAIAVALTFRLIHALGIFDLVWVLTQGGPADSTKTIAIRIYESVFRYGHSADAAGLTLLAAAAIFCIAILAGALARGRTRP